MNSVKSVHIQMPIRNHTVSKPGLNKFNKCENFDVLNLFVVNIRDSDYTEYKMYIIHSHRALLQGFKTI